MCCVELRHVCKQFGETVVLKNVDLSIAPDDFCVFIGPSGCGKSTLLRLIAGLEDVSSGEIEIDGVVVNNVPPSKRDVAMVFQSYALYPHMSAYENMAFGLRHRKLPATEIDRRVHQAASILHLDELLARQPRFLSGGERQRVAIGRAIVRKPKVFLFDEPLSNLDAGLRVKTRVELAKLHRELSSASMVYVTHDQVEAMTLASKIVLLRPHVDAPGEVSIAQVGSPLDLYHRPANQFVAGFIGSPSMNFFSSRVARLDERGVELSLDSLHCCARVTADGLRSGEQVTLGIRPEHVRLGEGDLTAQVTHLEQLGEHSYVYLKLDHQGSALLAKTQRPDIAIGDRLPFAFPAGAMHVFRADGTAQRRIEVGLRGREVSSGS